MKQTDKKEHITRRKKEEGTVEQRERDRQTLVDTLFNYLTDEACCLFSRCSENQVEEGNQH